MNTLTGSHFIISHTTNTSNLYYCHTDISISPYNHSHTAQMGNNQVISHDLKFDNAVVHKTAALAAYQNKCPKLLKRYSHTKLTRTVNRQILG